MCSMKAKVEYLKGFSKGLQLSDKGEDMSALLLAIIDCLDSMAEQIDENTEQIEDLDASIEDIEDEIATYDDILSDLLDADDDLFDDDDIPVWLDDDDEDEDDEDESCCRESSDDAYLASLAGVAMESTYGHEAGYSSLLDEIMSL